MNITKEIVLKLEKEFNCPIVDKCKTDDGYYVCFEQDIVVDGEEQKVTLDELMSEIKKYDNVNNFTNGVYVDDFRDDTWFEQVTFEWSENVV